MRKALYAGTFDPFTLGHCDIVNQALKVFDQIEIAIGVNAQKVRLFDLDETRALIEKSIDIHIQMPQRVSVVAFDNALVKFAQERSADGIVRGLRQVSDFSDEFTQHGINSRSTDLPIVYFISSTAFLHVSSSSAKLMTQYGLDTGWLVDPHVRAALEAKLR